MYPLTASRSGAGSRIGLYKVFSLGWFSVLGRVAGSTCRQFAVRDLCKQSCGYALDYVLRSFMGSGGLTFGLSMRYLGVALGQSIALGTCAGLGTILTPVFTGKAGDLTTSVIVGVVVTLAGIGIIGLAGSMKSASLSEEEKKKAVKDFNFTKGIIVALLAGFMSACFSIGLGLERNSVLLKVRIYSRHCLLH